MSAAALVIYLALAFAAGVAVGARRERQRTRHALRRLGRLARTGLRHPDEDA